MTKEAQTQDALLAFTEGLKVELRAYLAREKMKQQELAFRLGVHYSNVSNNLSSRHQMTEDFIARLSREIPEFSGAAFDYFQIKNGLDGGDNERLERARDRAQAQADIIAAAKEVEQAAARLTDLIRNTYR